MKKYILRLFMPFFVLFIMSGCVQFDRNNFEPVIEQSSNAFVGDSIPVTARLYIDNGDENPSANTMRGIFGVLLPDDWSIDSDSMTYASVHYADGSIILDQTLADDLDVNYPAAAGYHWWAGKTELLEGWTEDDSVTVTYNMNISDDAALGEYSLDYSSGYYIQTFDEINWDDTYEDVVISISQYSSVTDFLPHHLSHTAAIDENLVMTFEEAVFVNTGDVTIKKYTDDFIVEAIDITSTQVTGWGSNTITIDPNTTLENGIEYYVLIDEDAIEDADYRGYKGISDKSEWHFTVRSSGSDFDFDDTFSTKDFIDDEETSAYWDQEGELFTLRGAGLWTYADRITGGKELIADGGGSGSCGDGICTDDEEYECDADCDCDDFCESTDPGAGFCGDGICAIEEDGEVWCEEDCDDDDDDDDDDGIYSPKLALNDDDEQMAVWQEGGAIMFSKWDSDEMEWVTMDGESGAENISTSGMGCGEGEEAVGTCGDGICADDEATYNDGECYADCNCSEICSSDDNEAGFCGDGICSVEEDYAGECSDCFGGAGASKECSTSQPQIFADSNGNPTVSWLGQTSPSAVCGDGVCEWDKGETEDNCMNDCGFTYHLHQVIDGQPEEKYSHHFPVNYEGKNFSFAPFNNELELLIELRDSPFADIDQLELTCGNDEIVEPTHIRYEGNEDSNLTEDTEKQDLNVIVASENKIEAKWDIPDTCTGDVSLYMYANEYGEASPFHLESSHILGQTTALQPLWKPSTGHPDGYTYIKITDDDNNIYYDLDITMDNTDDYAKDWLEITIDNKTFRIDDTDDTYGTCPFGTGDKVDYKYQLCNVAIPKSELSVQDNFDFILEYYGTGGIIEGLSSNIYVRKWNSSESEWMSMDGDSELADIVFQYEDEGDVEPINLDFFDERYEDIEDYHMIKSSDDNPMIVSEIVLGGGDAYDLVYSEWDSDDEEWTGKDDDFYDQIDYAMGSRSPRLARTNNNDPMIVWDDYRNDAVLFTHWDGMNYSSMEGSDDYDDIYYSDIDAVSQIVVNSDGYPTLAHSICDEGGCGVLVEEWDGDEWQSDEIEVDDPVARIRTAVASDDTVIVTWGMSGFANSGEVGTVYDDGGIYAAKWNGDDLSSINGDEEYDFLELVRADTPNFSNTEKLVEDLEVKLTSHDWPMIIWSLGGSGDSLIPEPCTHFKQWSGEEWIVGDGSSGESDNLSGDINTGHTDMVINSDDEPSVVWEEILGMDGSPWDPIYINEIYFSMLPLDIESPKTVISQKINGSISGIIKAMLTSTENLEGESYIDYFLSGDGGVSWTPAIKGQEYALSGINDLRWRADLYAGSVPELHDVHVDYEIESTEAPECGPAAQTYEELDTEFTGTFCAIGTEDEEPSFPDYGQSTSWNCEKDGLIESCSASRGEQPIESEPEEDQKECTFDSVKDVTKNSATLRVSVDDEYADEKTKFKVEVENIYADEKETIKITDKPTSNGKATLLIDNLEEDTEYRFKVSYDEEDEYLYCPHSKTAKTPAPTIGPEKEVKYPECGNASKTYTEEQLVFTGTFCAKGTENIIPTFPTPGEKVSWTCAIDGNEEDCHAKRDKKPEEPVVPPVVKGGTEPIPEPIPEPKPEPTPPPKEPLQVTAATGLITGSLLALATSAVPLFATLPMAAKDFFIMPFLGLLARRRNEQNWGTVFEATTKQPIPGTKLMLTDQAGKEIETTYSDQHGRFGFLTENGSYVIQVEKSKFDPNFDNNSDPLYGEVYTGEPITIEQNKVIATNVAMSAQNIDWSAYAQEKSQAYKGFFSTFKKWSFIVLFYAGFAATAIITYFFPTPINFVFITLYTLLFIYDNFFKKKKYGTVESEDKKPIPFAIVSLHDKETNAKQNFAVTDVIGRYYLLSENGNYNMKVKGQPIGGHNFEKQGDINVKNGLVRKDVKI